MVIFKSLNIFPNILTTHNMSFFVIEIEHFVVCGSYRFQSILPVYLNKANKLFACDFCPVKIGSWKKCQQS